MITAALILYVFALLVAGIYLVWKLGVNLSASSLLVMALIALHGPAYLHYCWGYGPGTLIYERALENIDIGELRARLTAVLGIMFLCVVAGMAVVEKVFPERARVTAETLRVWNYFPVMQSYRISYKTLLIASVFIIGMLAVTIEEHQLAKIGGYLATAGGEFDKIKVRQELGGSQFYAYNIAMYSLAPFLAIAFLANWRVSRNILALICGTVLFVLVLLGKLATLSKAPVVIFLLQLILSMVLFKRSKLTFTSLLGVVGVAAALFLGVTMLAIPGISVRGAMDFLYYRIFMITNEVLVEYFSAIPAVIEHSWGRGIGLVSSLIGEEKSFLPTYTAVAEVTRGNRSSTSTAMFVADAWAEFSWLGVVMFSILLGVIVRVVDLYALRRGKTDEAIAIISGVSFGIFTALTTSLTTAMLSGGVIMIPILSMLLQNGSFIRVQWSLNRIVKAG